MSLRAEENKRPTAEQAAFPQVDSDSGGSENGSVDSVWTYGGMTKREYFIGCAMSGAMSSGVMLSLETKENCSNDQVVRAAIAIADKACEYLDEEKRVAKDGR